MNEDRDACVVFMANSLGWQSPEVHLRLAAIFQEPGIPDGGDSRDAPSLMPLLPAGADGGGPVRAVPVRAGLLGWSVSIPEGGRAGRPAAPLARGVHAIGGRA